MKTTFSILINATAFCIFWIVSSLITNALMNVEPPAADNASSALLLMWLCCLMETIALHLYIVNNRQSKWRRGLMIFATIFLIQFVLTQVESLYYIDHQTMPAVMILNTVIIGFITAVLFTFFLSWRYPVTIAPSTPTPSITFEILLVIVLGVVVYPLIYFTAGYFIAWQSEALRIYYTGTSDLYSFVQIMKINFQTGVYTFGAMRGIIWAAFAVVLLHSLRSTNWKLNGVILGLLFACLMTAQLLIPNPYMPTDVRMIHLVETASSNFVWGIVISITWCYGLKYTSNSTIISSI